MSVPGPGSAAEAATFAHREFNLRWAIRRAALGLAILALGVGSLAWLTHASIDPSLEVSAPAVASGPR